MTEFVVSGWGTFIICAFVAGWGHYVSSKYFEPRLTYLGHNENVSEELVEVLRAHFEMLTLQASFCFAIFALLFIQLVVK